MSTTENLDNKIKELWPESGPATQEIEKYIKKYSKEKIVIKCGGRILLDPELFNNFINDITILKKLGLTPIVVHGGGPRIKKKLENKFISYGDILITRERHRQHLEQSISHLKNFKNKNILITKIENFWLFLEE